MEGEKANKGWANMEFAKCWSARRQKSVCRNFYQFHLNHLRSPAPTKPRALAVNTTAAITTRSFIETKCNTRIYALKQFSGIGRGFQQGGWEGGADTGQVGLKLLSMFKMFKMFIIVKIANLRHTVASNAVLWKHPWPPKWPCSKNLMADSTHNKDSQSAHFSRYQELYAEFLGNEDESSVACNLFGSWSTLSF